MVKGQPFSVDIAIAAADTAQVVDLSTKLPTERIITQLIIEADSGNGGVISFGDEDITPTGPGKHLAAGADCTLVNIHWPSLYLTGSVTDDVVHLTGVL